VPVNTIGAILSRARKKLREKAASRGGVDSLGIAVKHAVAQTGNATPTTNIPASTPANNTPKPGKTPKPTKPAREKKAGE